MTSRIFERRSIQVCATGVAHSIEVDHGLQVDKRAGKLYRDRESVFNDSTDVYNRPHTKYRRKIAKTRGRRRTCSFASYLYVRTHTQPSRARTGANHTAWVPSAPLASSHAHPHAVTRTLLHTHARSDTHTLHTVAHTRTHARAHARVHIHAHTCERACIMHWHVCTRTRPHDRRKA